MRNEDPIPGRWEFFLFQTSQTSSGAHPASSKRYKGISWGQSSAGMKLTTHLSVAQCYTSLLTIQNTLQLRNCCSCILIVVYVFLDAATLTEVFPCFFLGCKANARVILAKTGQRPALFQNCCVVLCIVCFVLFYVLFVCKCVLPPGDNPIAVNKYIIYHTSSTSCTKQEEDSCEFVFWRVDIWRHFQFTVVFSNVEGSRKQKARHTV